MAGNRITLVVVTLHLANVSVRFGQHRVGVDAAIFDRAVANDAHFRASDLLRESVQPFSILGDHFSSALILFAPPQSRKTIRAGQTGRALTRQGGDGALDSAGPHDGPLAATLELVVDPGQETARCACLRVRSRLAGQAEQSAGYGFGNGIGPVVDVQLGEHS